MCRSSFPPVGRGPFPPHWPLDVWILSEELLTASSFYQQPDQSNLKKPSTRPACKDSSSTPSVTSTSVRVGPVSRWLPFLRSSGQEEQEQTCADGLSRSPCFSKGPTGFHRASLPQTSSIFDTGEEFDKFLPAARWYRSKVQAILL